MAITEWLEAEAVEALAEYPHLTMDQCRLYALMSDISEDCYCAGWMSGNEYRLWAAVADPGDDRAYGQGVISSDDLADLQELCERAGGWVYWHNVSDEAAWYRAAAKARERMTPTPKNGEPVSRESKDKECD